MAVANNADEYAATRQNIWFTAHNNTPLDGNLTGQCVTLEKWFLFEMTGVPDPFSARGHGKDVGRTLVNQGHAVEVPFADRKRGDIICYEFGTYGHVAVQLSGGRVFESNVNLGGVQSRIIDGERVYASRIGSENESWRVGKNPHAYRVKTYNEQEEDMKAILTPPVFNARYYLDNNPDLMPKYNLISAKLHWENFGVKEGRPSAPNFHVKEYLANYADLEKRYGKNYEEACNHFYNYGINEGRVGRKIVPTNPQYVPVTEPLYKKIS